MSKINTKKHPEALVAQRIAARELRLNGSTYIEIAEKLGCSRACASRWCRLDEDLLKPKPRGVKEKIAPDLKDKLKAEFLKSGLSVRIFIKKVRPELIDSVSQRTLEKYFVRLPPEGNNATDVLNAINIDGFCEICDKSFSALCHKILKKTNMSADELKVHFGLERKSEDFIKWKAGKRKPLKSTQIKVTYLAYLLKLSHGEMLPSELILSKNEPPSDLILGEKKPPIELILHNVYKQLFKINWDKLAEINLNPNELILDLINYGRKVAGEPRKLRTHTCFESDEFIRISEELLIPYFILFKQNVGPTTWKTSSFFDMPSYLLHLILGESYNQYYGYVVR